MTIMDAIYRIDELKPNSYSQSEKIKWLSSLDGMIKSEIIDTHENCNNPICKHFDSLGVVIPPIGEGIHFIGYNEDTDISTTLLVPAPYDGIYLQFLEMQIDYANGEYHKYNNSRDMYNAAYNAYSKYYNRTHMPKSRKSRFIF